MYNAENAAPSLFADHFICSHDSDGHDPCCPSLDLGVGSLVHPQGIIFLPNSTVPVSYIALPCSLFDYLIQPGLDSGEGLPVLLSDALCFFRCFVELVLQTSGGHAIDQAEADGF